MAEDLSVHPLVKLRFSGKQYKELRRHLFPGDGNEAVAVALCGRSINDNLHILTVHKLFPLHDNQYRTRTPDRVTWTTELLPDILTEAASQQLVLLKIHSHPTGYPAFSEYDDIADQDLFAGVAGWLDTDTPGGSAVMLPDGRIFGRYLTANGFTPIALVSVAGDELSLWHNTKATETVPAFAQRTAQAFGTGTTKLLSNISVAVIGCSGTGSPTIEMLTRLGVGELVIVDPDRVEQKNLNRIYNATQKDAAQKRYKVEVLADSINRMGLGTSVIALPQNIYDPDVIRRVAQCDVVFGCMDSVDGRDLLNRLSTFYTVPYFDAGIRLIADGRGSVNQVCGSVHYLQPGGSSLLSRAVYTPDQLAAACLYRNDPEEYDRRLQEKYIQGVNEDSPAVISVNSLIASLMVNEFLARLHPFRIDPNSEYDVVTMSLTQMRLISESYQDPCQVLSRWVGRGDIQPLLNMPELSERKL